MIMPFKVLKYFSKGNLLAYREGDFKLKKMIFLSEILTRATVDLIKPGLLAGKTFVCDWNLRYLEANGIY